MVEAVEEDAVKGVGAVTVVHDSQGLGVGVLLRKTVPILVHTPFRPENLRPMRSMRPMHQRERSIVEMKTI